MQLVDALRAITLFATVTPAFETAMPPPLHAVFPAIVFPLIVAPPGPATLMPPPKLLRSLPLAIVNPARVTVAFPVMVKRRKLGVPPAVRYPEGIWTLPRRSATRRYYR